MDQKNKAARFFALHAEGQPFVIPNPWDVGSARLLAAKGFLALATTSVGVDRMNGKRAGTAGRNDILANAKMLAEATPLPLSIDLEDCYGANAPAIADTIEMAAATGAVGGSIEDAIYGQNGALYEIDEAVERVKAAVKAASALPFKFTLTARAEQFLHGEPDLDAVIARLRAFSEAGADVLFAPGLRTQEQVKTLVAALDKPVNVLLGMSNTDLSMADMHQIGVARISLGSGLYNAAMAATMQAIDEIQSRGTFGFTHDFAAVSKLDDYMA